MKQFEQNYFKLASWNDFQMKKSILRLSICFSCNEMKFFMLN